MLEVCFGDSVKGALRVAQHCGRSIGGASFGVIMEGKPHWWQWWARRKAVKQAIKQVEERQCELNRRAIALGGDREDIVGVSFDLSYGEIASPIKADDCPRKRLIWEWLTADPWGELEEMEAEAERFWRSCLSDLEKLLARARAGESVRIWADHTPSAACGLLYVADLLEGEGCEITVVSLPRQCSEPDGGWYPTEDGGTSRPSCLAPFLTGPSC